MPSSVHDDASGRGHVATLGRHLDHPALCIHGERVLWIALLRLCASKIKCGVLGSIDSGMIIRGRAEPVAPRISLHSAKHPLPKRVHILSPTKPFNSEGIRFRNTKPGKRSSCNGRSADGFRCDGSRKLCKLTPSRKLERRKSRDGCSGGKRTSSQKGTCGRVAQRRTRNHRMIGRTPVRTKGAAPLGR